MDPNDPRNQQPPYGMTQQVPPPVSEYFGDQSAAPPPQAEEGQFQMTPSQQGSDQAAQNANYQKLIADAGRAQAGSSPSGPPVSLMSILGMLG